VAACYPGADSTSRAAERALAHHRGTGRIGHIRRGLYAVPAGGAEPSSFLIAAKAAPDAVLAYHGALEYHAIAYSLGNVRTILTTTKAKSFRHAGITYRAARFPRALDSAEKRLFAVESREERGATLRVTSLERTLVDLLDRPEFGGGWEEVWRSFDGAGFVDPKVVVRHALNLASRTTAARVGWFLEEHREQWMIPESAFDQLSAMVPRSPVYLNRSHREHGVLHHRWNLIVPQRIHARGWAEVL